MSDSPVFVVMKFGGNAIVYGLLAATSSFSAYWSPHTRKMV